MVDWAESYRARAFRETKASRSLVRDVVVAMIAGALTFLGLSVSAADHHPTLDALVALMAGAGAFVIAFGGEYFYRLAQAHEGRRRSTR